MIPLRHRVPGLLSLAGAILCTGSPRAEENPHGDVFKNRPVPAVVDFNRDVKPFFSERCYHCHGPDEKARKAKLRLDLREDAVKERDGSFAISPKQPDSSEVMKRIVSSDPDEVMPPPKDGKPLSAREIEIMKKWIAQGAPYAEHWAFVKPVKADPPRIPSLKPQASSPIDAFVSAKLAENGLELSGEASRHTLVRRVALDLTGLPPTPEEVGAFINDAGPQAYDRMVDRFLAKPGYGERWARVWLDIARYADSAGYGSDPLRPNIWPYRDWVIGAFNRNLPYDQFTLEQLAGDLLPDAAEQQIAATAFHRNTMTNTEGGTDDEEFRVAAVKDRVALTVQAWMGLTMGCAQCHSHKFDPISQQEYYQFYAIFNQTEDSDKPDEFPTMPFPTAEQRAQVTMLNKEIADLEARLKKPDEAALERELQAWEPEVLKPAAWTILKPESLNSKSQATLEPQPDDSVLAQGLYPAKDTYTIRTTAPISGITAFKIEVLPDDRLPNKGPGRSSSGNFVLSEISASAATKPAASTSGRFVRIDLPGKQKIINIAEVQVFSGGKNSALKGVAKQSGTYADAEAGRAIDGKTDGNYGSRSVSHTAVADNPWWEVDLGAEQELEKIVVWNRTDGGTASRLGGAKLSVLDAKRQTVFDTVIAEAPKPSAEFSPGNSRALKLANASADFSQGGFDSAAAIDGRADTGWAVGGGTGVAHAAVFEVERPLEFGKPLELTFTLAQNYGDQHNLGRFRISATTAPKPVRELPPAIRAIVARPKSQRAPAERAELIAWFTRISKLYGDLQRQIEAKKTALAAIKPLALPVMKELAKDRRRETRLLNKGSFLDPGVRVEPALLRSFHRPPDEKPSRITVAKWLTSRENPLTARVAVNRLWAQLFGTGLVETEEDFGTQGALPSHPELLDWLAVEFMDLNWDMKEMLKEIVMSATYRQSSKPPGEAMKIDPRNRLLSHYPRRRLDAEQVRDQALALSGLLSSRTGGPSVYPPQPDGLWRAAFNGQRSWETSKGENRYRRGLYTFWRRTVPYPSMATFDAPSRENPTMRRVPTNTPLQAFVTLNDPAFFEMAQALAARMLREGGDSIESRVRFGLELCLARPASDEQIAALAQLFRQETETYKSNPEDAKRLSASATLPADKSFPNEVAPAEKAAWVEVANVLLNLDGVLTKG